jgi:hypothetical protein
MRWNHGSGRKQVLIETDSKKNTIKVWSTRGHYPIVLELKVKAPGRIEVLINGVPHETITYEYIKRSKRDEKRV